MFHVHYSEPATTLPPPGMGGGTLLSIESVLKKPEEGLHSKLHLLIPLRLQDSNYLKFITSVSLIFKIPN